MIVLWKAWVKVNKYCGYFVDYKNKFYAFEIILLYITIYFREIKYLMIMEYK